jgi:hypothetical protein
MIVHRNSSTDFGAFQIASMMDKCGLIPFSIVVNPNASLALRWIIFSRGTEEQYKEFEKAELEVGA